MYNEETQKKIKRYFIQRFDMKKANPGWLLGTCPSCGKKLKFGINVSQNRVNCFVCGISNPLKIIMEVEGFSERREALSFIRAFENTEYLDFIEKDNHDKDVVDYKVGDCKLPEGYKSLILGDNLVAQCARNTLATRGFNINNLAMRGIGYVDKPKSRYFGYIIIPYYLNGNLIYFTSRKIFDIGPKFKNPTLEEANIGKTLLTYNADALAIYDTIHLVESATNSLTLGPRAIGLGGKKISPHQYSSILKSPVKNVNIFLDPDAITEALKLGLDLCHYKKVRVVLLPEDKDVNNIGKKASFELMKNTPFQTYNELFKRKLRINNEKRAFDTHNEI
jgi:DNA primase